MGNLQAKSNTVTELLKQVKSFSHTADTSFSLLYASFFFFAFCFIVELCSQDCTVYRLSKKFAFHAQRYCDFVAREIILISGQANVFFFLFFGYW